MEMLVFGQEAHMEWCYDFVQFDTYGVMHFEQACEYLSSGHLKLAEVSVMPLNKTLTVIELTPSGRRVTKKVKKLWTHLYVPFFKQSDPNWTMEDAYVDNALEGNAFALSRQRFDTEKSEGRLSGIIAKCPAIGLLNE